MNVIKVAVRRRVLTTVVLLIAIILGGFSYFSIQVRRFPDVDFPMATVTTVFPGGSPQEVETEITKRIEDAVSSISGVDEIRSYSQQGLSLVMIQFELEADIDVKKADVDDEVGKIRSLLPEDAEDPVVGKFDIAQTPVVTLALKGALNTEKLFRIADEIAADRLSQVTGVADVEITGGRRREIHILLDPAKMRKHGVSTDEVAIAVRKANLELPAGRITQPRTEYTVRTLGRFENVEEIRHVPVRKTAVGTLELRHIARVEDTYEEERTRSRSDGENAVILSILKQSDANDVLVSEGVRAEMETLQEVFPEGASLTLVDDTADYVRGALSNVRTNIVLGILLTSIVLFLFLGSGRATIIAVVVMPAALVITFTFLNFSGISINILTLTALALSMGIVVNNAILVLENSHRFLEQGFEPGEAAVRGTQDISLAIISSTATNLVVFLPIAFMGELIGRFFREFGLTIVFVTTVSLFVSFTLTPMMCAALLRNESEEGPDHGGLFGCLAVLFGLPQTLWTKSFDWFRRRYGEMVDWCLQWRKTTIALTFLLFVTGSLVLYFIVGREFFPPSDEGRFSVLVETKTGSSLDFTTDRVKEVERKIEQSLPAGYIRHHYSRIGNISGFLGSSSQGANLAEVGVSVIDKAERPEQMRELLSSVRPVLAEVHSAKTTVSAAGGAGPGGRPLQVEIRGDDLDELRELTARIKDIVARIGGTSDVDQSYRTGQPEIRFIPRRRVAGRYQLTVAQIAMALRTYVEGREVSQFRDRDEDYDMRLKLDERYRKWAEDVEQMFVKSLATGEMIPLSQIVEIEFESGPTVITRKDRRRMITVSAELTGERKLKAVKKDVQDTIANEIAIPEDVEISYGGEVELMNKNFPELFKAMGTAAVLTFLCVAGIIESFGLAVIIILAIPISLIGVTLALLIGDVALNVFSLMAMIMLVGMVVNNAIIILDYATGEEREGESVLGRIKEACQVRFRLIVMANMTTIAAMIPLSLGLGFAGEIIRPLGVVQIGGLFAAATLSLVVIPVIYTIVEDGGILDSDEGIDE